MSVQRASGEECASKREGHPEWAWWEAPPPPSPHTRADKAGSQRGGAVGGMSSVCGTEETSVQIPVPPTLCRATWRVHLPICRMGTIRPLSWAAVGTESGDICKGCLRAWCAVGSRASPAALRSSPRSLRWRPLVAKG